MPKQAPLDSRSIPREGTESTLMCKIDMIKVFVIEDHRLIRWGLKKLLSAESGMEIVAEFADTALVLQEIPNYNPHVIICDINLPGTNGITLTQRIKAQFPQIKVVILTMYKERSYILRAVEAGVDGYLHKDVFEREVIEGIKQVVDGNRYFSREVSNVIIHQLYQNDESNVSPEVISPREKEVLTLITRGYRNREIADKLFLSIKTVDKHRANLIQKLKVRNTADLVRYAVQHQLVDILE